MNFAEVADKNSNIFTSGNFKVRVTDLCQNRHASMSNLAAIIFDAKEGFTQLVTDFGLSSIV